MNTRCMQSSAIEHYTKSPYPAEVYSRRILLTQQAKNCVTKIEPFNRTASIQLVCGAGEIYNSGSSVLWRRDRDRKRARYIQNAMPAVLCATPSRYKRLLYTNQPHQRRVHTRRTRKRKRQREKERKTNTQTRNTTGFGCCVCVFVCETERQPSSMCDVYEFCMCRVALLGAFELCVCVCGCAG